MPRRTRVADRKPGGTKPHGVLTGGGAPDTLVVRSAVAARRHRALERELQCLFARSGNDSGHPAHPWSCNGGRRALLSFYDGSWADGAASCTQTAALAATISSPQAISRRLRTIRDSHRS